MADRNTRAKVVWRARIVLGSADGESVKAVARATGKSKPCVWRWQRRFAEDARRRPLRRTGACAMAKAVGISHTSVQRIWREAGLKPHLTRPFKVSSDPRFEEKVTDIVGSTCARRITL